MQLGCPGTCRCGTMERCAPVTVTFNLVQKLVKISRLGLFYVKKAIQLHWVAFNQPNNHHNNPKIIIRPGRNNANATHVMC